MAQEQHRGTDPMAFAYYVTATPDHHPYGYFDEQDENVPSVDSFSLPGHAKDCDNY
jgi:hypothetical protein